MFDRYDLMKNYCRDAVCFMAEHYLRYYFIDLKMKNYNFSGSSREDELTMPLARVSSSLCRTTTDAVGGCNGRYWYVFVA